MSPIIYGARLIYVSLLSGAFSKDTAIFVSYSTRQHRYPLPVFHYVWQVVSRTQVVM